MILLVTGAWNCTQEQLKYLEGLGNQVFFLQNEKDALPLAYEAVEGVICNGLFLYHPIEKFVNLQYIQLTSAGFDRVPMEYVQAHNIVINNARGVYSIPMAEFALSSVLSVYKEMSFFRQAQAERNWKKHRGLRELSGKRVCILGCGSVGSECAHRFTAMGCNVVGIDAFPMQRNGYNVILPVNALKDVAAEADIIVLTLPLTQKTRGIMDADVLNMLPENAVIVNISRGAIMDTEALISCLTKRPDLTAILDVFEEEPLPADSRLWGMNNVLITPHNSFVGEGNTGRLQSVIFDNLRLFSVGSRGLN